MEIKENYDAFGRRSFSQAQMVDTDENHSDDSAYLKMANLKQKRDAKKLKKQLEEETTHHKNAHSFQVKPGSFSSTFDYSASVSNVPEMKRESQDTVKDASRIRPEVNDMLLRQKAELNAEYLQLKYSGNSNPSSTEY